MIECSNTTCWLFEKAQSRPSAPAVITEDKTITYKELYREALSSAGYFAYSGIAKNDNVGILYRHNYGFYAIVNALWIIGAIPVPLNTKLTPTELAAQIKNADIKYLIVDEYNSDLPGSLDVSQKIVYSHNFKSGDLLPANAPLSAARTALIMHTSGSSGKPKAVVHTFGSLYESVKLTDSLTQLNQHDVLLASLPLYHVGGFMMMIRALLAGASVAFPESLHHDDVCSAIIDFNPSILTIVPTMLLRFNETSFKPNSKLRHTFIGGGPAADNLVLEGVEGGWPLIKVYGSTETCSMVTAVASDGMKNKPGTAGRAMPNVELKIVDEELVIKSPSLFKEYFNNKAETLGKLVNGYYHTGDFGHIDADGYLFIESRREDIIITGGENVSVTEVETVIKQYELIDDAAIFPVDNEEWGQIVCAAVVLKEKGSATSEEIKDYLKGLISSYKIPKIIIILNAIPRTELGKVKRSELVEIIKKV
jgi:o-succinylbenzoate---CoA ligase